MGDARRAVFFDRDGVLTEPIWNPATAEYESPHTLADLVLCADTVAPLRRLAEAGFALFIVSNQPSYAKGKTTLEEIRAIADAVTEQFRANGVTFLATYYCYHHPRGIVPEFSGPCACRKPSPHFLLQAAAAYTLDLQESWMMGDRDSDVLCGQRAGCRTILIEHPQALAQRGGSTPDYLAADVAAATRQILAHIAASPTVAIRR